MRGLSCKLLTVLPVLSLSLFGQVDANKGSISGLVLDSKEAAVPDASVTAHNGATGATRDTRTNERGYYRLAAVDPGSYDVRVEVASLAVSVKNVVVNVGAGVEVDVKLGLNASSERIEADTSSVSVTDASASQVFPREEIRDLPIDGRRFQDFASLAPGAQANAATRNQLSFLGQSGVYANVMVDGGDYNEPFLGGIRGSERAMFAFTIPQSAIQEFQVIANGYAAEYGRSTGGIVNAITRSGGNAVHGEGFYQFRSGNLGADNPFGLSPIEKQQQFGGSAGGPVRKDRIFWFGAAEGQLAAFPRTVRFAELDSIANNVTPDIRPAYDYFRSLERPYTQTNNAIAALGRMDYQFHDASRLTGRFSGSRNLAANAISAGSSWIPQTPNALSNNGTEEDNIKTASAQWTSILPHLLLNDFRVTYSAEDRARKANSISPTVEAGVIGNFGTRFDLPLKTEDYRLQAADSLTVQRGLHSILLGTDYSLLHVSQHAGMNQYGAFKIQGSDVRSLLSILSRSGGLQGNRFDDPGVVYRRQAGNAAIDTRAHQIAFYAQDEWRARPNLTISYGLRWEGQLNPSPETGNTFLVNNVRAFSFPLGGVDPTRLPSELNQWAPRIAAAWNAGGDGRTVVRASAGTFYGQTPLAFYADALNNFGPAGGDLSVQIAPIANMTVYQQFARAGFDLNRTPLNQLPILSIPDVWTRIAGQPNQFAQANVFTTSGDNFRNPRSVQAAGSLEHRTANGIVLSYQFNLLNTVHLPRVVDFNVPAPVIRPGDLSRLPFFGLRSGTARPNPNLGAVYVLDAGARSTYTGHSFRAQYRTKRLDFMAHYTLSYAKSNGDLQWPFAGTTYQNPFDLSREWGWSSLDARHQSAGYVTYQAPKGFEITGLFRVRSGLPIDATTGGDFSELLTGSAGGRPLQRPGIPFPRNAFCNLGYRTVDTRLLKSIPLRESLRLQLSAEFFNVFNFSNLAFISAADYPNNPAFIYGPGVLSNGRTAPAAPGFMKQRISNGGFDPATMAQQGGPFQVQLGMRLLF